MENNKEDAPKEKEEVKQETTPEKPEDPVKAEDGGNEKPNLIEQAKTENDRKAELLEKESALLDRKEKLQAEEMVGGKAGMGVTEKPKELTDEEYADAVSRGEANPFKEDGIKV